MSRVHHRISKMVKSWRRENAECYDVDMQLSLSFAIGAARVATRATSSPDQCTSVLATTLRHEIRHESDDLKREQLRSCLADVIYLREQISAPPKRTLRAPARGRAGGTRQRHAR